MNDEAKAIEEANKFVKGIMHNCPDQLRDIDIIAACGFMVSAYANDTNHAAKLLANIVARVHEYYRQLESGELKKPKVH